MYYNIELKLIEKINGVRLL